MTFWEIIEAALAPGVEAALATYLTGGDKDAVEDAGRTAIIKNATNTIIQAIGQASTTATTTTQATQNLTITDNTGATPKVV